MIDYLTVQEAAASARCEHKAIRRAIERGELAAYKPGAKILIRADDFDAWINGARIEPGATQYTRPAPGRSAPPRRAPARRTGAHRRSAGPGTLASLRAIEREAQTGERQTTGR